LLRYKSKPKKKEFRIKDQFQWKTNKKMQAIKKMQNILTKKFDVRKEIKFIRMFNYEYNKIKCLLVIDYQLILIFC